MKNWRTTSSAVLAAFSALLTMVAMAPYELEGIGTLIAPKYKAQIAIAGAVATFILKCINGVCQKDKSSAPEVKPEPEIPPTQTDQTK